MHARITVVIANVPQPERCSGKNHQAQNRAEVKIHPAVSARTVRRVLSESAVTKVAGSGVRRASSLGENTGPEESTATTRPLDKSRMNPSKSSVEAGVLAVAVTKPVPRPECWRAIRWSLRSPAPQAPVDTSPVRCGPG